MRSLSSFKAQGFLTGCLLIVFSSLLFILSGCAQNNLLTETYPKKEPVKINRIAVFPIQRVDPDQAVDNALRCEVCGAIINLGSVEAEAEKVVEEVFLQDIQKTGKYEIVPPERVQGVFQRISAGSMKSSLKELLVKSGRELGADAILYGQVYRFRERKGYAYGTDQTAAVAFTLHLIDVRDGSLLWKGRFDKTQTSLMENIFQVFTFYKERGRWLTARELTDEGVSEMLTTFPGGQ